MELLNINYEIYLAYRLKVKVIISILLLQGPILKLFHYYCILLLYYYTKLLLYSRPLSNQPKYRPYI